MILVVDVGNTNITFGIYDRKNLVTTFRLMAKTQRTSDEYGVLITELLSKNHVNTREIEGAIIAVAAYELYGGPVLVLDFGTATTYDLVDEKGCFCAGITAPGIRISAKALWEDAAKLPEIEIKKPASILAQETISSMQAGLVYGQIGQTEYIVNRVKKETGYGDLKVVATGGLGRIIAEETDVIQEYNSALTLEGLRIIYEKNNR